jgi:hypothetical protein
VQPLPTLYDYVEICLKFNRANKLLSVTCYLYCLTLGILVTFIMKSNC